MANWDSLNSAYPNTIGYYLLGRALCPMGVAANAVVTIPMFGGGVTSNVGGNYILRRITARDATGAITTANVAISGPLAGQIVSTQGMATVNAAGKYKDFTLSASFVNSANVTTNATVDPTTQLLEDQFLYVNVLAAAAANNTVEIAVFGEPVVA